MSSSSQYLDSSGQHRIIANYKGYQIINYTHCLNGCRYLYISMNNQRQSILCLNSIKACENVIDTYLRKKVVPMWK